MSAQVEEYLPCAAGARGCRPAPSPIGCGSMRTYLMLVVVPLAALAPVRSDSPKPVVVDARLAPELDAFFQRTDGWIGGDGVYSVALKPDRILWLFSDTWVGKVRERKRTDATIVNNSIGIQDGLGEKPRVRFLFGKEPSGK